MHEPEVAETSERVYRELVDRGWDVLLDDRDVRPGIKFKDADLLGTPLRVTVGSRNLQSGKVETKFRSDSESELIPADGAAVRIEEKIRYLYDSIK
jgi:prolyl-tRNA synthetase